MREFKPMKELINAVWAIVKAIRGESNEQLSGESTWQDFLNIMFDNDPDTPKHYLYRSDDPNYEVRSFKDIKISERLPVTLYEGDNEENNEDTGYRYISFVYDHHAERDKAYNHMTIKYGFVSDEDNGLYIPFIDLSGGTGAIETEITDINGKKWYSYYSD